jgi:hypothetical protein
VLQDSQLVSFGSVRGLVLKVAFWSEVPERAYLQAFPNKKCCLFSRLGLDDRAALVHQGSWLRIEN